MEFLISLISRVAFFPDFPCPIQIANYEFDDANLLISNFVSHLQQVVELNGYVIIVVEGRDNKIKLYGSPADRDNLEVGDEILDVNERKLEDLPRAEVIRYIHEVRAFEIKINIFDPRLFLLFVLLGI